MLSTTGHRVEHSVAAYLSFAQDQIADVVGEHTRWGMSHPPIAPPRFETIADSVAQIYKQCSNTHRRRLGREARDDEPHPGSLRGGGSGSHDPPSPIQVQLLLEALAAEAHHEWCVDESDDDE